jgi:hypothetical protein
MEVVDQEENVEFEEEDVRDDDDKEEEEEEGWTRMRRRRKRSLSKTGVYLVLINLK